MSFWTTSAGAQATGETQSNDDGFKAIPKGDYKSILESVTVNEWQGQKKIAIKARIIGDQYKNRVLFLNINAWAEKDATRDRAINLLVKLCNVIGVALPEGEPDDQFLSKLADKPLMVGVGTFKPDDKDDDINFLTDFEPCGKGAAPAKKMVEVEEDSDIPF